MADAWWVRQRDGKKFEVHRHDKWLAVPANRRLAGLSDEASDEIEKAKSGRNAENEIRTIGVKNGLIRIRAYRNGTISIQFWAARNKVRDILWTVYGAIQNVAGPRSSLWVNNLKDNEEETLSFAEFVDRLKNNQSVLNEEPTVRPRGAVLQESVNRLIGKPPV